MAAFEVPGEVFVVVTRGNVVFVADPSELGILLKGFLDCLW